jgi:surfactin family lipopeptide synthetase A
MKEFNANQDSRHALLREYLRANRPLPAKPPSIRRGGHGEFVPLSCGQRLIWLHSQSAPDRPLYTETWTLHFYGPLDIVALKRALNAFVARHEAWRTVFPVINGEPVQVVQESSELHLKITDLRNLPANEREAEATRLAERDARVPFDLARGPLIRPRLVTFEDKLHRVYTSLHHSIFDGVAIYRVFLPEVAALYDAFREGRSSPLIDTPIQYRDYTRWQHERISSANIQKQISHWRERLRGELPLVDLPTTWPRPATNNFAGSMLRLTVPTEVKERLRQAGAREGATLFMVLLAALYTLLYHYSTREDLRVGTVTAGRNDPELHNLVGFCLNTLVLRVDVSGQPTFAELMRRVRDAVLDALANDEVPFDVLVHELNVRRDPANNPLFQVMFSLEPPVANVDERWDLTQMEVDTGASKFDLDWELEVRTDGITGKLIYSTALFSREAAQGIIDDYVSVLRVVAADPQVKIASVPLAHGRQLARTSELPPLVADNHPIPYQTSGDNGAHSAEIERQLLEIWRSVLGTSTIDVRDNFFELGGHSLAAIQVLAWVESRFGRRVRFSEFLHGPTIELLAALLHRRMHIVAA